MFKLKMESYIFPEYADCQKTLVGASIARPYPFICEKSFPGKRVVAPSWRATNGRPYTFIRPRNFLAIQQKRPLARLDDSGRPIANAPTKKPRT